MLLLWVYRLLFLPVLAVSAPYYLWRMLRRGGYGAGFMQRLGWWPNLPPRQPGKARIWIQAVSVGEVEALGPLLHQLAATGTHEIILTTTTSTGLAVARQRHAATCLAIGSFPLDFWPCSSAAWKAIRPDVAILTEGELWPEHILGQARMRNIPVALINARLSDRSFKRHARFPWLARALLQRLSWIGAGSAADAQRLRDLGARAPEVTGNIKFDGPTEEAAPLAARTALRQDLGLQDNPEALLILGSSTWPGEERLLLNLTKQLREAGQDVRLLLVPRHAERRDEVRREIITSGLNFHQRSTQGTRAAAGTIVHLADTTGELRLLTRAADLAFCGKSLAPHEGGQTPIEAAATGVPIVYGPAMTNFKVMCEGLEIVGAAYCGQDAEDVSQILQQLVHDRDARQKMQKVGPAWLAGNRGASERTLRGIERLLPQTR